MFCCKQNSRLLTKSLHLLNYCTIPDKRPSISKIKLFTKILAEFSGRTATKRFLDNNPYLLKVDDKKISKSFKYLTNIGITVNDIRNQPKILCTEDVVLRNRYEVFMECGCSYVNSFTLKEYSMLANQSESYFKVMGIIDKKLNLQQKLADMLDVTLRPCNENGTLTKIRMHILQLFYTQNNFMSAEEFHDLITRYPKIRHHPYRSTKETTEFLVDELELPKEKLKSNFYLLMYDSKSMGKTLSQLTKLGITKQAIAKYPTVLTVDAETVPDRVEDLYSRKEFKAMEFHPLILKLMLNRSKAHDRLDYLNQLDKKCFSIGILTGPIGNFRRFVRQEHDKNESKDCVIFLAKTFNRRPEDVKNEISRHKFWLYIPFIDMRQTIDTLLDAEFELNDIYANIHLVLYSGELILKQIEKLKQTQLIDGHMVEELPKSVQLKLVLYHIESEFHFTGDGVWLDRKSNAASYELALHEPMKSESAVKLNCQTAECPLIETVVVLAI